MQFPNPLIRGRLIKRYKRFLADVALETGETVTVSCANTGSMKGLVEPGVTVWLSESDSPTRKYRHTWEMVEHDVGRGPAVVGINTGHPNRIVSEAIEAGRIPSLKGYASLRREVKYGKNSRIDILLEDPQKGSCYVEIKNVHFLRRPGVAEFPDSVTVRGVKHLGELADMVMAGHRAVMLYLVQRADATRMTFARDIDPAYGAAFDVAAAAGVEALAYRCALDETGIELGKKIPIVV
ncbi:MAG: DNA/RNA nuclease SfsA [Alphaproteobacteria bacterium]|nr:DNA/RNA nuclease SfsA [Alphaproteobacteria bacterium]